MDATTPPTPGRSPSVIVPISLAIDRTRRILFAPFDPAVWFVLGFCAWLARLFEGGSGGGTQVSRDDDFRSSIGSGASEAFNEHTALVVIGVTVLLALIVALVVVLLWISSRGKLMFVDGVVSGQAAVVEPWKRFRRQGNSLFLFRLTLMIVGFATFMVLAGMLVVLLMAVGVRAGDDVGPLGLLILVPWIVVLLGLAFAFALVGLFTNDFVVPTMWVAGCGAVEGWRRVMPLLSDHLGSIVLYVLIRIVIGIVLAGLAMIGCCVTCCLALVPYLGTVLLLPLHVFRRSYSIEFLGQLGGDYARLVGNAGAGQAPAVPGGDDAPPEPSTA